MLTDKQLETCREMDLLSYLEAKDPDNLVRLSDREYCTREHDSLKISNGKWMWWSQGIGGKNAIDYLTKVKGMDFIHAAVEVLKASNDPSVQYRIRDKPIKKPPEKHLIRPEKSPTDRIARLYLSNRCIEPDITKECIYLGLIYESLPMHNVIFLGKDSRGNDRYAAYRSTGEERILGECAGSDKRFSFRLGSEKTSQIHVFESAIDLLSYATLIHLSGGDYHRFDMLSLGGVYARARDDMPYKLPKALNYYLETHPQVNTVYLHLDNDRAGWQASKGIQEILQNKLKVIDNPPPHGKDVNDFLCLRPLD